MTDCIYHPRNKEELKKLTDDLSVSLGSVDTSLITDMSELFMDSKRQNFSGIEKWDTHSVQNMDAMFYGCITFN